MKIAKHKNQELNKSENLCRLALEQFLGIPFIKIRPAFLRLGKNRALQLDGYNSEQKIAFEHQGIQHFFCIPFSLKLFKNLLTFKKETRLKKRYVKIKELGL